MADTETVEIEARTWTLSPTEFRLTQEKLAKINARAEKRGFTGRWEAVGTERTVEKTNPLNGLTDTFLVIDTVLTGEAPKYDNTRFLARVEWNEDKPIVQAAPGVEGVDRAVLVPGYCAHCNKIRFRKNTYVVERDGVQVQIGSTCIKDYLGWSTQPVLTFDDPISDADFEGNLGGYYGQGAQSFTPLTILQTAWAAIRCFGFVRASDWSNKPTATVVKEALGVYKLPNHRDCSRGRCAACSIEADLAKLRPLVPEAEAEARRVLDFVLSDDFSGSSEYVQNLKTVAAATGVEDKFIGLLASAPQAYAKHIEKTLIRKAREERPSEHVGAVKERLTLTVTIENIRYIDSDWGTTTLYTLRDPETGNVFKWFASDEKLGDERDVTVTIKGTVKKHETFNGLKSTVLTRCALVEA